MLVERQEVTASKELYKQPHNKEKEMIKSFRLKSGKAKPSLLAFIIVASAAATGSTPASATSANISPHTQSVCQYGTAYWSLSWGNTPTYTWRFDFGDGTVDSDSRVTYTGISEYNSFNNPGSVDQVLEANDYYGVVFTTASTNVKEAAITPGCPF